MVSIFQVIAKLGRPNCPDEQGGQDKDAEAHRDLASAEQGHL